MVTSTSQDELQAGSTLLPGRVLSGGDCMQLLPEMISANYPGCSNILIISDVHMTDHSALLELKRRFESFSVSVDIYGSIDGEPTLASVQSACNYAASGEAEAFDFFVGFGGGSAMDTAKLVAATTSTKTQLTDAIRNRTVVSSVDTPLALIPTTAGTGAEASPNAILSENERKRVVSGKALLPAIAVLDASPTTTMPVSVTAASGADALAHALETLISTKASPLTALYSGQAIELVARNIKRACSEPSDLDARRNMLHAAHAAGISLSASTLVGHSTAYCVAARTGLAHGVTTGLMLGYAVAFNYSFSHVRLNTVAETLGVETPDLSRWVLELMDTIGLPTSLDAVGISESDIPEMVTECLEFYPRPNNPRPMTSESLATLFKYAVRGDVTGCQAAFEK